MVVSMEQLHAMNGRICSCGKKHSFSAEIIVGKGVLCRLPEQIRNYAAHKAFCVSDQNTWRAAGEQVGALLRESGIVYKSHCFQKENLEPDEWSVGSAVMHYEYDCDIIIGIGSGVINDICKILSAAVQKPYIIIATAPSMDGYASATSSMTRDALKSSLPSRSADVIIGDTDILCKAPYLR